jgi:hypothetical protein
MKIKITSAQFIWLLVLIAGLAYCSSSHSQSTGILLQHHDHGFEMSAPPPATNLYPTTQFAGINLNEVNDYRKISAATLPAEQDPDGNWGKAVADLQLSLRFRNKQYLKNESVPALIVLRNLSWTNTPLWWRNALPDHGYEFTLSHGTNIWHWTRPQNPPPKITNWNDGTRNTDPYRSWLSPHRQELTVIDLKKFFNLSELGEYSVQVQIQVPTSNDKTNIVSGTATFQIVEKKLNPPRQP